MSKPIASLSLDLDNKWSYLKTHGEKDWESFPSYFDVVVPRILRMLDEKNLRITFFIVGQDAALEKNHATLRMIADSGHEIGNHSFNHEPWLHLYSIEELREEFEKSEQAILDATGHKTIGFRGPGFSLSRDVLNVLAERNYQYDCTVFPTFLGPLARAYYFFTANLSKKEKQDRKALFGRFSDGFQPLKPFRWDLKRDLIEIPVSTMPIFKIPFHLSYILYLGQYSKLLARFYFWKAITLCRLTRTPPSLLLHPLDFLGADDDQDLSFFPGMNLPASQKLKIVSQALDSLSKRYEVVTMREHARRVTVKGEETGKLKLRNPQLVRAPATN